VSDIDRIAARLTELGFSLYEARTYVGLLLVDEATGYSVGNQAGVPQPKVYEILPKLVEKGAAVRRGEHPARYAAVPPGVLLERLEREFQGRLDAARSGLESLPRSGAAGPLLPVAGCTRLEDALERTEEALKPITDPFRGEPLLAVPAIEIDVALVHAALGDRHGNVQHHGTGYGDRAIHAASRATCVAVERLVSTEEIRRDPRATSIPDADAVVRAPFGCHPFGAEGFYPPDREHLQEYLAAARHLLKGGDRTELDAYLRHYVLEPRDHVAYLERVGLRRLLALSEY
jgi:hypothetical protein